jgi:hypothetical protein
LSEVGAGGGGAGVGGSSGGGGGLMLPSPPPLSLPLGGGGGAPAIWWDVARSSFADMAPLVTGLVDQVRGPQNIRLV